MAEVYFDPSSSADTDLLRSDVQDHSELARVAEDAELDCIEQFTERFEGNEVTMHEFFARRSAPHLATEVDSDRSIYVLLDGYAEDAADADGYDADRSAWTGFAKAFRRSIARVVEHRLRYRDDDPTITQERRGRREVEREPLSLNPDWPRGWDRPLHRYDLREGLYHT